MERKVNAVQGISELFENATDGHYKVNNACNIEKTEWDEGKMKRKKIITAIVGVCFSLSALIFSDIIPQEQGYLPNIANISVDREDYNIPEYSKKTYVEVNHNRPYFTDDELTTEPFEVYSELDSLGRCGAAYANVCQELMPTKERGQIGKVKPSGWHTVKYPGVIKDLYLYNRCHLIGFQLAGENANEKNLITGTRHLNVEGMLPFENEVADYVDETNHHVLYRVTPVFTDDNLVADGVLMEAYSVEDFGEGVSFCVFIYNVQPGIEIDYRTGESRKSEFD